MRDALYDDEVEHPNSTIHTTPDPVRARELGQLDLLAPTFPANRAHPRTSIEGVHDVLPRVGKQQRLLLIAYVSVGANGLTNVEAGERSGLSANPTTCFWKRITELQRAGFIVETGVERKSLASGSLQAVRAITADGLVVVERLKWQERDKG